MVTSCSALSASTTVCAIFAVADVSGGKYKFSSRIFMLAVPLQSCRFSGSRFCNQEVAEHQRIHLRPQETINRFLRLANDWLVVVERSIQHHRNTRLAFYLFDQFPITWVRRLCHRLKPPCPI